MATRHHIIRIAAPRATVFETIADVASHHRWQKGLLRSECGENARSVGARGAEVRRMLGREIRFPYEITVYEPPARWGFRAIGGPIRPEAVIELHADNEGTRVESKLTVRGALGWLVIGSMVRQQQRNYAELKRLLEAAPR